MVKSLAATYEAGRPDAGGLALRFARVLRYRPDKRPEEADTIHTVRALHQPSAG
jgi:ATP-dependent DNA ligase